MRKNSTALGVTIIDRNGSFSNAIVDRGGAPTCSRVADFRTAIGNALLQSSETEILQSSETSEGGRGVEEESCEEGCED